MLDSARYQWEEGRRRLRAEAADPLRHRQLCDLVDAVVTGLKLRVGQHFTLAELAAAHAGAEDWVRDVVLDALPPNPRVGVSDVALVEDAAFDLFARGAVDFRP